MVSVTVPRRTEIFGVPTVAAHAGTEAISALLTRSAAIRTKGGRVIRAEKTLTELSGEVLTSTIYFPREEPLTVDDREMKQFRYPPDKADFGVVASPPAGWLTAKLLIPCSTVLCSALAKRTKPPFGPVFEGVPELLRI